MSVTAVMSTEFVSSCALVTVLLLALLVQKEITSASEQPHWQRFSRALDVAIVPLGLAFLVITAVKVMQVW